jgi:MOSC domain-containing protein YiiM
MSLASIVAVAQDGSHRFSKSCLDEITLREDFGVVGDAHAGATVQHLSRVALDPTQPNLRQVHLIAAELFDELAAAGFEVKPGELGENITTIGIDLLALPRGTKLQLGSQALIEITGLRNPCAQIDGFRQGLLKAVLPRDNQGNVERRAGVMAIVLNGGTVRPGDAVTIELPPLPHTRLERV